MSFLEIISTILIEPLILAFEIIYVIANRVIGNPGLSIIVLSLVMNFLILPLYMRADAMQEEEKEMEQRLRKGVAHIKKTFKGDERMMMLQTFYRQNNYKPTYVLRGAVSLFLEIPFFIAAYRFLSELQLLQGVGFGPITDLGKPDALLTIGGVAINILPIIMTAVNLVSCAIFTKGSSAKQKIQLYGMALFFLVFLYTSPSGLVFYWTLNNVFSLVKTIFYKLKNPVSILSIMSSLSGMLILTYGIFFYHTPTIKRITFFIIFGLLLQIPVIYMSLKNKLHFNMRKIHETSSRKIFLAGCMFMTLVTGMLIPSEVIKSSPQEFVDVNYFYHPGGYIISSFCLAAGIFLIWGSVFYWLAKPTVKCLFDNGIWVISGIAIVNYMFFGKDLGILNAELQYEDGLNFSFVEQMKNALLMLIIILLFSYIAVKWKKQVFSVFMVSILAIGIMSVVNMVNINSSVNRVKEQGTCNEEMPKISLSKTGKNVVVIMLDRAYGGYIPYLFNEKPELQEQFDGFTYYSNVVSFGGFTNFGVPALMGGYEYTPEEMNRRSEEKLVSKHNEALKIMPVLFDENGYDVTVCDPTYANYQWIPDLSIYDDYPGIKSYITKGKFSDKSVKEQLIQNNKIKFFCYSVLKSVPLCFQELLYDQGNYNQSGSGIVYSGQMRTDLYTADGMSASFMEQYSVLTNLTPITEITENSTNNFMFLSNDTTHEPQMLQLPDYVPKQHVDNRKYEYKDGFTLKDGQTIHMDSEQQIIHYHTNMAAMLQVGRWLDYLRENEVYDNTKIILVSDHGAELRHFDNLIMENSIDLSRYYPLLMVKDFNSEGFVTTEEFMTNADVPTLALEGAVENPINPFTGNKIDSSEKTAHEQFVLVSSEWDVSTNNGNTFIPGEWYSVHSDMREKDNWKLEKGGAILPKD